MENENTKNYFAKDESTCLERLNYSQKGDEVIIAYPKTTQGNEPADKALGYDAYIAVDTAKFRKARIFKNQTIRVEDKDLTSADVLETWKNRENRTVRWNRKKFKVNEVDQLLEGKNLDYKFVNERYNPMKRIADMQLSAANFLQTVTPNAEINYYKFRDGKQVGVDSYLCIKPYVFLQLKKKITDTKTKERTVEMASPKKFSVWEIVNTLPKSENTLSPDRDINIRCKWNKFDWEETQSIEKGAVLSDTAIEDRRQKYLQSDHYYIPDHFGSVHDVREGVKPYVECWVHKETKELLFQKNVGLVPEKAHELQINGQIKQPNEIPGVKLTPEKQQTVNVVKRQQQGMER